MVNDNQPVIATFKDEIEKLEKQIEETNDRDLKLMLQEDINRCAREIKKLSETEYSKIIDYIIQDNKEITEMQETVEDEPKLPPEGFGTPENDPFGWFQAGEKQYVSNKYLDDSRVTVTAGTNNASADTDIGIWILLRQQG